MRHVNLWQTNMPQDVVLDLSLAMVDNMFSASARLKNMIISSINASGHGEQRVRIVWPGVPIASSYLPLAMQEKRQALERKMNGRASRSGSHGCGGQTPRNRGREPTQWS